MAKESLSLFQIETELDELLDVREEVAGSSEMTVIDRQQSLAVIDKQIDDYLRREAKKVDGIANTVQSFEQAAILLKDEANRLYARAQMFENRVTRIKERCCDVMRQTLGDKAKLETPNHTLRVQKNGGLAPLVLSSTVNIPASMQIVSVKMSLKDWIIMRAVAADHHQGLCAEASTPEPNNSAIRDALTKGEKIEGCYIADRGFHLRVL